MRFYFFLNTYFFVIFINKNDILFSHLSSSKQCTMKFFSIYSINNSFRFITINKKYIHIFFGNFYSFINFTIHSTSYIF